MIQGYVWDFITPDEREALTALAGAYNVRKALEIGTMYGGSAAAICTGMDRKGVLVCIDTWEGTPDDPNHEYYKEAGESGIYDTFLYRLQVDGIGHMVIPLRGRSEDLLPIMAPGSFDLVFVDGDHHSDAVRRDIRLAIPLVKPHGGILAGHDYGSEEWPEVRGIVDVEVCPMDDAGRVGTVWAAIRSPLGWTQAPGVGA